jgi:cholesterol oxidase
VVRNGQDSTTGVIDKNNRIFTMKTCSYYGAMISQNWWSNPSLSITAIAERAMDQISEE